MDKRGIVRYIKAAIRSLRINIERLNEEAGENDGSPRHYAFRGIAEYELIKKRIYEDILKEIEND